MLNNIQKIKFIAVLVSFPFLAFGQQTNPGTSIWPGDVNNNGVVNHVDVLYIGATYGEEGGLRDSLSIVWDSMPVPAGWQTNLPNNGPSTAFADCDGNGVVEEADLGAIAVNYGLEHDAFFPDSFPHVSDIGTSSLFFNTGGNNPVVVPNQLINIPIDLGSANNPIDNFYGLAFSIEVDPDYVDMQSLEFTFESSWTGAQNEELLTYQRRNNSTNTLDIVLSRRSMTTTSGGGTVGVLSLIIEGDVPDYAPDIEVLTIYDVHTVDQFLGKTYEVESQKLRLDVTSPVKELPRNEFSIYPNPVTNGICTIRGLKKYTDAEVELLDVAGRQLKTTLIDNNLYIGDIPAGIYFIHINTPQGILTEKIFINN